MEKTPETQTREEYFDQAMEEQEQLEKELEKQPNNEKIRGYVADIQELCEKLLEEIDREGEAREVPKTMGNEATKMMTRDFASEEQKNKYIDSQGFIHSDAKMAVNGDPNRENYSSHNQSEQFCMKKAAPKGAAFLSKVP